MEATKSTFVKFMYHFFLSSLVTSMVMVISCTISYVLNSLKTELDNKISFTYVSRSFLGLTCRAHIIFRRILSNVISEYIRTLQIYYTGYFSCYFLPYHRYICYITWIYYFLPSCDIVLFFYRGFFLHLG